MSARTVGVVVDPGEMLRWHHTAIDLLGNSATVTVHAAPASGRAVRSPALLRWFAAWERRRLGRLPRALEPAPLDEPAAPFEHAEVVDLVVWLAASAVPAELARRVPLGVWYLAQGEARTAADCPLLREVLAGSGCVETTLWSFDGESHKPLLSAIGKVDPVSYLRSLGRGCAKAAHLPHRMLTRLENGAGGTPAPSVRAAAGDRPGILAPVLLAARVALRALSNRARLFLLRERWMVAWRTVDPATAGAPEGEAGYRLVEAEEGHYYADPFPVSRDGRRWLFFEDFSRTTGLGSIAVAELADGGTPTPAMPVLDLDTHLSYPFIARRGDDVYLLPENRSSNRLVLWRARDFPRSWELVQALFEGSAVGDATLAWHGGRVWLFAAIAVDDGAPVDELCVFHADDMSGPWTAHPLNPVVSDVRRARPAGPVLHAGGALLRPAQDCSRAYGWRTVFNRIDVLTPEDYRETPVAVATPLGWRARRTHTFARDGDLEAVDVMVARPRFLPRRWVDGPASVQMRFRAL